MRILKDFRLNKRIYNDEFLPRYNDEVKYLIQFCIVLPFYIPIIDNNVITIKNENNYLSFDFSKKCKDESSLYNTSNINKFKVERNISKVEMTFAETSNINNVTQEYIDNYFKLLLERLNQIILAYKIQSKNQEMFLIREEMLSPAVIYRVIDVQKWNEEPGLLLLHMSMPYNEVALDGKQIDELIRHCEIVINNLNPFANVVDYMVSAKRFMNHGFYEDSVINTNIAVESYIRNMYKYFLTLENPDFDDEKINNLLEEKPFKSIITKEMHKRLGGTWDVTKEGSVIKNWYDETYLLRNKIIHGTRKINREQVEVAWNRANELFEYIKKLVIVKKKQFPELYNFLSEEKRKEITN